MIIDSAVGSPIFSTLSSMPPSIRRCFTKLASGAIGCARPSFFCSKYHAVHAMATTNPTPAAYAPLATPICGNPIQPRISAGVTSRLTAVEISSVRSGVVVSPTPRNIDVTSRNANTQGAAISMMRAYSVAPGRMSAGVPRARSMGSVKAPPNSATTRPAHRPTESVVPAIAFTRSGSLAPQAWPISTAAPEPRPIMNEIRKNSTGKKADTEAMALTPSIWPR